MGRGEQGPPHLSFPGVSGGSGPGPALPRCMVDGSFSPSLRLLICRLGVVMAPTAQTWGRRVQSLCCCCSYHHHSYSEELP